MWNEAKGIWPAPQDKRRKVNPDAKAWCETEAARLRALAALCMKRYGATTKAKSGIMQALKDVIHLARQQQDGESPLDLPASSTQQPCPATALTPQTLKRQGTSNLSLVVHPVAEVCSHPPAAAELLSSDDEKAKEATTHAKECT